MKKDKVIEVAFGFKDLVKELEELSKTYELSLGAQSILNAKEIDARSPWFDFKNGKWAIILTSEECIVVRPYEVFCKDYLKSKEIK